MSLKDKLMNDLKEAMRDKDIVRKDTVQMVRAAILQTEKDNKTTLDDEKIIEVIAKELKRRRDVLPEYVKSGRQELIDKINKEIEVLLTYLPKQLTKEELLEIVKDAIKDTGATL